MKKTLLIILFCSFYGLSFAQEENFITEINSNEINKNADFEKYETSLQRNKNISSFTYIKLGSLSKSQKDGKLSFIVPGKSKSIFAKAKRVKYFSDQDYEWIGKTDEDRGTVIILCRKGRINAHISTPDGVYEISSAPNKLYCFKEINISEANDVGCATDHTASKDNTQYFGRSRNRNARMETCNTVNNPRVLVLYTPAVFSAFGDDESQISDLASMSVTQFNTCLYNSDNYSGAVLHLAGVVPFNLIESYATPDLEALIASSTAQSLRSQYMADFVVLLTNGDLYGGARGKAGTVVLQDSRSYAVVQAYAATANKTFPHEIGHLYGCRHDDDTSESPSYAQGHNMTNFLGLVMDRTMMSTSTSDGSNRCLNFSNPDISVSGRATGTSDHDNSRRIDETFSTVSSFQPNPSGTFSVLLEGPTLVHYEGLRSFELVYSCGTAPYTFSWAWGYDGINYYSTGETSDTYSKYFYESQTFFLKGTITTNGQSYDSFTSVDVSINNPYRLGVKEPSTIENVVLEIYPNPAKDMVEIKYYLKNNELITLDIINQSGQIIHSLLSNIESEAGSHIVKWSTGNIPAGTYLCRFQKKDGIEVKQVTLIK